MREQRGISLIALIVTIIVVIILASVTMSGGLGSIEEARDTKVDVELRNLKDAVSERMVKNAENEVAYPFVGKKVEDVTSYIYYIDNISNEEIQKIVSELNDENIEMFRLVGATDALRLGVDSVDEEHYYLVDYSSGKVYGTIDMKAASGD